MITTLKKYEVRSKETGNLISEMSLKLHDYTYKLETATEVIMTGIEAEREYDKALKFIQSVVDKMNTEGDQLELIIVKGDK